MKKHTLVILAVAALCFTACQKDKDSAALPAGTWNVVSDSTYSGVGHIATGRLYVGQSGDYFKFSGNNLSIKEGAFRVATATYTQVKDTLKLSFSYLEDNGEKINGPGTEKYIITSQTSTSMKLMADPFLSPGGIYEEYITLSR
jgi:hypothetical protein